jgi:hypothetical protein
MTRPSASDGKMYRPGFKQGGETKKTSRRVGTLS